MLKDEERARRAQSKIEYLKFKAHQQIELIRKKETERRFIADQKAKEAIEKVRAYTESLEAKRRARETEKRLRLEKKAAAEALAERLKHEKIKKKIDDKLEKHAAWLEGLAIGDRAIFRNTKLKGFDFNGKNMEKVKILGSRFEDCSFVATRLEMAKVDKSVFAECNFFEANLDSLSAKRTSFAGSSFTSAICYRADFSGCDFKGTIWANADVDHADFVECNLKTDADLSQIVNLEKAIFEP